MSIRVAFNRNYGKWFLNDVIRAVRGFGLIEQGESVAAALSGGKDSVTLLYILEYLRRYSFLRFDLVAAHVRTGNYETGVLREYCDALGVAYLETELRGDRGPALEKACSLCARLKRGALAALLRPMSVRKLAYGHHADDAAETFFMNVVQHRRLGSFAAKVDRGGRGPALIRPLIYVEERVIRQVHGLLGLPVLDYRCPHAAANVRRKFREAVGRLDEVFHTTRFVRRLADAMGRAALADEKGRA